MTTAPSNPAPRTWPIVVAAVIGIFLLVGLGSWQVLRLQWKLDLIEKRVSSLTGNPVTIYDIEAGMEHGYDVDFLRVRLNGKYRHDATRHVYRPRGKWPGFQVITPFIDKSGFIVLVDRGFIDQRMHKAPIAGDTRKPEGDLTITGITRNRASGTGMIWSVSLPRCRTICWMAMTDRTRLPRPCSCNWSRAANREPENGRCLRI